VIADKSYSKALAAAILLHILVGFFLIYESHSSRPALTPEVKNEAGDPNVMDTAKPQEIVKAVSIDKSEVMDTVNRLKQERAQVIKQEQAHQKALAAEASRAKAERLREQQKLVKLKQEAAQLAAKKQKELQEEKKHLAELALQKAEEKKRLEALKKERLQQDKEQQVEKQKLEKLAAETKKREQADLEAKNAREKLAVAEKKVAAEADALKKKLAEEERLKAQNARAAEEASAREAQAANEAQQRAKMSGEVDRYKALIINAISQRWILPENVDSSLSSQFRIRLAPDGAVLEVSLTRSSGDPILDRSAQSAIYKASPLPVPNDPSIFSIFREISLTVRPENVRG
jgi:colicin import membrane protein